MSNIYLFSGLGADRRAFQYLGLTGYNVTFINWIAAEKNETIEAYAKRLLPQITTHNPILIGLSFGGIMAVEVAKLIKTEKIILIASVKTYKELPPYFQNTRSDSFHNWIPGWVLKKPNFIIRRLFGVQSLSEKKLLNDILKDIDPIFLKWAIGKIATWRNEVTHPNLLHIHGTADKIFPFKYVRCDVPVTNGGHFMTVNRAEELTLILRNLLH
ncbi:alpha/beta fold hydrolase [Chitinophagaceae bacterium LWZ2-11]